MKQPRPYSSDPRLVGDLGEFTAYHRSTFSEGVVNGDLNVIVPDRKLISMFHHEGYFAILDIDKQNV